MSGGRQAASSCTRGGNTFDAKRTFQDRQSIHPALILLSKIRPVTPEVAGSSPSTDRDQVPRFSTSDLRGSRPHLRTSCSVDGCIECLGRLG
jgi:hypothetical protein